MFSLRRNQNINKRARCIVVDRESLRLLYACLKFSHSFFSESACGKSGDSKQHKCNNQFRPKKLPDFASTTQPNTQTTLEGMGGSVSQARDTLYYLVLILQHYNNSKRAIAGHVNPPKWGLFTPNLCSGATFGVLRCIN